MSKMELMLFAAFAAPTAILMAWIRHSIQEAFRRIQQLEDVVNIEEDVK